MAGDCAGSSCPVEGGFYGYEPSLAGNLVLLALYGLLVPIALFRGVQSRTHVFSAALITGLLLDVLGFIGRVLLRSNRASETYIFLSLFGTLLGPILVSESIFLVLPHVFNIYGEQLSPVQPILLGVVFFVFNLAAAVVQIVGVACVAFGMGSMKPSKGAYIVAGGLGLQAATAIMFILLHYVFVARLPSKRNSFDRKNSAVYDASQFHRFLRSLEVATMLLLLYSIYRTVEMAMGLSGSLFQSEVAFMVADGAVPLVACILLVMFHPGTAFGSAWAHSSPRFMRRQSRPAPLIEHPFDRIQPHERYDPEIRKQFPPMSPRSNRRSGASEPASSTKSPGLPPHPKSGIKPPSPRTPSSRTSPTDRRFSERQGRRSQPTVQKDMVDSDALW